MTEYSSKQFMGGGGKLRQQRFLASGNFIVPDDVTSVWVTVVGGGGSGARKNNDNGGFTEVLGGGGGQVILRHSVQVTPKSAIPVVVGAGGAGYPAALGMNAGNTGGASSFGGLTAQGGGGGPHPSNVGFDSRTDNLTTASYFSSERRFVWDGAHGRVSKAISFTGANQVSTRRGLELTSTTSFQCGTSLESGSQTSQYIIIGGGSAGYGGAGTRARDAGTPFNPALDDAPANSGAGSGGFRNQDFGNSPNSRVGAGGSGIVIVEWFE